MIRYSHLAMLRFADFLPVVTAVDVEGNYEWMNGLWHYEGIGFSWFGAPMDAPHSTACIQLFADEVPADVMDSIMARLGLPLSFGMTRDRIEEHLGKPFSTSTFSDDRISCDYMTTGIEPYWVSCTILRDDGLAFFSLMRADLYQRYRG
ncbi:MAG: hypothetical protein WAU70_05205 [Flavobacteriales bacterium]